MATQTQKQATTPSMGTLQVPQAAPKGYSPAAQYKLGKPYSPRANTQNGNAVLWAAVQKHLAANKGQATGAALWQAVQAIPQGSGGMPHYQFMGYAVRRGWLVAA